MECIKYETVALCKIEFNTPRIGPDTHYIRRKRQKFEKLTFKHLEGHVTENT